VQIITRVVVAVEAIAIDGGVAVEDVAARTAVGLK
jgi:hypothetical protein